MWWHQQIQSTHKKKLRKAFGFIALPHLSTFQNAVWVMGAMPTFDYWQRATNQALYNLTSLKMPPQNLQSLLGLGLKFIPTPYQTTTFPTLQLPSLRLNHLGRSLHLRCFFCATGEPLRDFKYNPKLHLPSKFEPPDKLFPNIIKRQLQQFEIKLYRLFCLQKSLPTSPRLTNKLLNFYNTNKSLSLPTVTKILDLQSLRQNATFNLPFETTSLT